MKCSKTFLIQFLIVLCCIGFQSNVIYSQSQYIKILGVAQDGGIPHIGCKKACCNSNQNNEKVVCLGLIDKHHQKKIFI